MSSFDPTKYLSKVNGQDYMQIKWRLVWFRDAWPHGFIDTEHIEITDQRAIFRCTVHMMDADGVVKGMATGHGSETPGDFRDYIEKAEQKAVGRALAAIGFGTQFAGDAEPLADTPVERPQRQQANGQAASPTRSDSPPLANGGGITQRQFEFIAMLAREAGLDQATLQGLVQEGWAVDKVGRLNRQQASEFIEELQRSQQAAVRAG